MLFDFLMAIKIDFAILDSEISVNENIIIIKKWNWNYKEANQFQNACVEFVLQNPSIVFLVLCSHPNVLTMGRGLQKLNPSLGIVLKEFDPIQNNNLNSPVEYIKRGGGLTFHYPGQLVFYPILNSIYHKLKVYDFMIAILNSLKSTLEECLEISKIKVRTDLIGLWTLEDNKLASIGLAANRFVTYHGLALNFFHFNSIQEDLKNCSPCGLSGDTYKTIEDLLDVTRVDFDNVCTTLVNKIYDMIERQRSSSPIIEATSELVNDLKRVDIALNTESSLS